MNRNSRTDGSPSRDYTFKGDPLSPKLLIPNSYLAPLLDGARELESYCRVGTRELTRERREIAILFGRTSDLLYFSRLTRGVGELWSCANSRLTRGGFRELRTTRR